MTKRHRTILELFTALVALLLVSATPAFANVDRPMQAHPSPGQLAGQCTALGGTYDEETVEGIHGYSCTKKNCDGKGGTCAVNCGDTGCTGSTPSRINVGNVRSILQNGDLVDHVYGPDEGSATPNHPHTTATTLPPPHYFH